MVAFDDESAGEKVQHRDASFSREHRECTWKGRAQVNWEVTIKSTLKREYLPFKSILYRFIL